MSEELTDEQWQAIDKEIVANLKLSALQQIRAVKDCELGEALKVLYARYDDLRVKSPERFAVGHDGYWEDFYS